MKNRKLILIVSLVLALTMSLGGTLAYLTDTDADVNTMVLGNVKIEQHEYQRADADKDGELDTKTIDGITSYVLEDYVNGKPLLPAIVPNGGTANGIKWDYDSTRVRMTQVDSYGTADVFNTPNAVDKFVTVENTGKTDAYVRTFIAFEVGNATLINEEYGENQPLISSEIRAGEKADGKQPWTFGFSDYVVIDGNKYLVYELIYTGANLGGDEWRHADGILPAGDTTYPSLCQVYMASWANNQEVVDLDGNANGTYDILVLSQAIQAAGWTAMDDKIAAKVALDTGFGEATKENIQNWFQGEEVVNALPVVIKDNETLAKAISDGETNLVLVGEGPFILPDSAKGKTLTISGDGASVIATKDNGSYEGCNYALDGSTVTFKNITINTTSKTYIGYARCKATFENCTINGTYTLYDTSVFNNCTFNVSGDVYNIWTWGAPKATFNNCTFNSDGKALLVYGERDNAVELNDCVFNDNGALTAKKAAIEIGSHAQCKRDVVINGVTVNGYEINDEGTNTGTTLWGNKNSMSTELLNVVVDGVDVY